MVNQEGIGREYRQQCSDLEKEGRREILDEIMARQLKIAYKLNLKGQGNYNCLSAALNIVGLSDVDEWRNDWEVVTEEFKRTDHPEIGYVALWRQPWADKSPGHVAVVASLDPLLMHSRQATGYKLDVADFISNILDKLPSGWDRNIEYYIPSNHPDFSK